MKDEVMEYIEEEGKKDIDPTLLLKKGDRFDTKEVPGSRGVMESVIEHAKEKVDEKELDWYAFAASCFVGKGEEAPQPGGLSEDPDAEEAIFVDMYDEDGGSLAVYREESLDKIEETEDREGRFAPW